MWIDQNKDIFLLRNMPFKNALVSDQVSYRQEVFSVAESSFSHIDLYSEYEDGLEVMLVVPFVSNYTFKYDEEEFDVSFGDCVITTDPSKILHIDPDFILTEIEFYFSEQKKQVGTGSKEYEIISVVRDEYRLKVFANSEEEALEISRTVSPSKWEHLEIDTHLEQRHMVRMGRWGNLTAKEIK